MNRRLFGYMIAFGMFVFASLSLPFAVLVACITGQQFVLLHVVPVMVGAFLAVRCWIEISTLKMVLDTLNDVTEEFEFQQVVVGILVSGFTAAAWGAAVKHWPAEAFNVLPWQFVASMEIVRRVTIWFTNAIADSKGIRLR